MRLSTLTLSLAVLGLPGLAAAEGSITVYGIADAAVQALDGVSGSVLSGGLSASRLGFRGSEDLGGGLRAAFTLESGINLDDGSVGQGGAFYGRQAFVALHTPVGSISAGRQYASLFALSGDFSAFGNGVGGASTAVIGGFGGGYEPVRGAAVTGVPPAAGATGNGGPVRVNNSIRYETPELQGLRFSALYGAGEVAGATQDSRLLDVGLRYRGGPFEAMVSVIEDKLAGDAVNARTTSVAASYALGAARLYAGYLDFDDRRPASADGKGWWFGGDYRIGTHLLKAQWVRNEPRTGTDNRTDAYGLGWAVDLSRRSTLYASVTRFDNEAAAGPGGLGRFNAPVPAGLTRAGDNAITEVLLGLRHVF